MCGEVIQSTVSVTQLLEPTHHVCVLRCALRAHVALCMQVLAGPQQFPIIRRLCLHQCLYRCGFCRAKPMAEVAKEAAATVKGAMYRKEWQDLVDMAAGRK